MKAFRKLKRTVEPVPNVQRTLIVADNGQARLPVTRTPVGDGLVTAIFDPISLAAMFATLGHKVSVMHAAEWLKRISGNENEEVALADICDNRAA